MKTIVLATNNPDKVSEIRSVFTDFRLLTLDEAGIVCHPEENGASFRENSLIKARAVCAVSRMPSLADDSGLCTAALDGAPGIYSARYAAMNGERDNNSLLLSRLEGVSDRRAWFEACISLVLPDGREFCASGRVDGVITYAPRGNSGFGYDPIFEYSGRTLAEMSAAEKNSISHRARALAALKKQLCAEAVL